MAITISPVEVTGFYLSGSVGAGGDNERDDVETVVTLLNGIPPTRGGVVPPLRVDQVTANDAGMARLIDAIKEFQRLNFRFTPDGNITPNKNTHKKLCFEFLNRSKQESGEPDLVFNGKQLIWGASLPDDVSDVLAFRAT